MNFEALHDKIIATDIETGEKMTNGGIIMLDDNGKSSGIHPRWATVWAVGPEQHDVKVGDRILIEHGRWTRGIKIPVGDGFKVIRQVDPEGVLMVEE